jgi:hypothetical protein
VWGASQNNPRVASRGPKQLHGNNGRRDRLTSLTPFTSAESRYTECAADWRASSAGLKSAAMPNSSRPFVSRMR